MFYATTLNMPGHFSAGFTLDTYAHVTTSAQKEAAQTTGNVLSMQIYFAVNRTAVNDV